MAQKMEKEETEFKKVPETITLTPCVNNCGVTVNSSTNNSMCQKCFNATTASISSPSRFSDEKASATTGSATSSRSPKRSHPSDESDVKTDQRSETASFEAKRVVNRCSGCRKRVGLTGFRCRCGELFCSEHRYSDRHDCSYDYKTAGREAIARENPVVKAAKIVKI
ncbi:unnamed protein product [Lupinus luteus]|uniref:AN1-type domain-containing protein n=1 Tax=Lupinus luteus TaxID=3873 RepID=A0AAV1Y422_LUPLU